ncbi:hypothetical protein TWF730_007151 [Orbilia blumenaviensis]|uniref:Stonustoxin-like helical domain-containing protein n=1 Tax=Orbilia blumenaviensis TaxID=1796055 RepID=A0AAV9VGE0_9PEZI
MALSNETVITRPALGQDVQLGMLYDVRTSNFFAGLSLWKNDVVNAKQNIDDEKIQNADFEFSYSLEESRKKSSLNVEGSLSLDLKILSATGSAKYLNDTKSSAYEARVDVSCNMVRRTRRIPQETLASMTYEKYLDDSRYTHFVGEVVEGGSATLSFAQSCSSAEEAMELTGELKVAMVKIPLSVDAKVEFSKEEQSKFENVKVSYSGAIAEKVVSLEDALRVAGEMPEKLKKQMNTLSYTLLPLTLLDSKVNRLIRSIDTGLVIKTAAALKAGTEAGLKLKDLVKEEIFQKKFPAIKRQISNFADAFSAAETEFTKTARRLLPELRDGSTDENAKITELQAAAALFQRRTEYAERFIRRKWAEATVLRETVATLLAAEFENHLDGFTTRSLIDGTPRLLLSFGGPSIGCANHPLQASIESGSSDGGGATVSKNGAKDDDDSEDDEDEEWFEDQQIIANIRKSCADLRQQRLVKIPGITITFAVASIDKAYRPGKNKKTRTNVGDIVLDNEGKLLIVTGMLPKAPAAPELTVEGQTITVAWHQERQEADLLAIPTTGYSVKYRRLLNRSKDGAFPRASENELFTEVSCTDSQTKMILSSLSDDCDYEVALSVHTIVGASRWSLYVVGRTAKQTTVASEIVDFFKSNRATLEKPEKPENKPWDLDVPKNANSKQTLFLGLTEIAQCPCTDKRFAGKVAVRIVDVAAEFKPEIKAALSRDEKNTIVVLFTGTSGHGKSTEINAFISYLLGGQIHDQVRIMVVDDRGAKQAASVTQIVTCFRIRPFSSLFQGKTLLVVDTPGYGDPRDIEAYEFVTAAMSDFFKTVSHVNSIIFTCRANEVRTTFLKPVSSYVFSLFAKNVHSCLRTVYTFSDAGAPPARTALTELGWPVENGEIFVNNSTFTQNLDGSENDAVVRESWLQTIRGQYLIMQMLLRMTPVPTEKSAQVTQKRILLEQRCQLAEKKILRTANRGQNLISGLNALASVVRAAPSQKIEVKEHRSVKKALPDGKYIVETEVFSTWFVPEDMIKHWNAQNNTLEAALLTAMDSYLKLQEELRNDILELAKLSEELTSTALLHDPAGLISYIDTLIQSARASGAPNEQVAQLSTARNTLILVREVQGKGEGATRDSGILLDVIGAVRQEMGQRIKLSANERAKEEEKACNLYNELRERLPAEIRDKAPAQLRKENTFSRGALYPENLEAIVKLVGVVLKDGGVVAALYADSLGSGEEADD